MPRFYFNLLRLVGLLPVIAQAVTTQQAAICKEIDSQIPGRVTYAGSLVYNATLSSYYTSQERDLTPGCVFTPTNTSEVSRFVKLVNASGRDTQFAIRSGGHTLFTGGANIDGGITVDMRSINGLVLSEDHKIAQIGGGAIWSDIYPQLMPHNLTVMGGRIPGIGVGGFTTGGGINFWGRRNGFDCDNVYGYEVVIASGEVVYASASSHPDLWLALKGGSNNFGIITRFDLAAWEQGLMWGGIIAYNYSQSVLEAQAQAFSNYMDPANFDDAADMGMVLDYVNPGGVFSIMNTLFYVDPVAYPPVYDSFTSIPSLENTFALQNVSSIVQSFGKDLPSTLDRSIELVYSFKSSNAALYLELFSTWQAGLKALANLEGLQVQYLIQPHPVTNGTNSLGLPAGETDLVMGLVTAGYDNAADDTVAKNGLQAIVDQHEAILKREGLYLGFKYLNYADISQDPISSYGAENKAALQAASRKYDPEGLFQTGVPGGFKLFT